MCRSWVLALPLVALSAGGCYQYHVAPCAARPLTIDEATAEDPPEPRCEQPQWDPATEWEPVTAHVLAWGLLSSPEYVFTTVCPAESGIDQVRVKDNLAYTAATLLTLGFWSPKRIEYTCAKPEERPVEPAPESGPAPGPEASASP